jgi:hypothetical protein
MLTTSEYKNLSEICRDVAQVFFASLVVAPLAAGFDIKQYPVILLGLVMSFLFWSFSFLLAK